MPLTSICGCQVPGEKVSGMQFQDKDMKLENLTLEAFTYGGECFGRLADGRAVFVPHTLPGEQVSIRLVEEKRGFVRGELVEILEPSPNRVPPRCPHTFSLTPKPSSNQSGEPESSLLSEAPSGDDTSIDVKEYWVAVATSTFPMNPN